MIATLKRIFIAVLTVGLILALAVPCFAVTQSGKITVTLKDKEENNINDLKVNICQIAELNKTGYYPTSAFENSGISIAGILNNPDETVAQSLVNYIKSNDIDIISLLSEDGTASFDGADLGIWVIFPDENGKLTFNPYIVLLPYESSGKLYYQVDSAPKLEDNTPNQINIYVVKKWNDKNNASKKRPDSVTIELLNGDKVVSSVVLSEENGWSHNFNGFNKNGNYSVREKAVANYKVNYSGDATNGFIVTNTYSGEKLPQTGQYWWPIMIFAIAGICFILLGIYEIGVKKNGKKK